jgi:diguanylate cyclase (GGDEF)-like protein
MKEPNEAEADAFAEPILVIDPARTSREKAVSLLEKLGRATRQATDAFEGHALVDGAGAVIAAHPVAAPIYPRLRSAGIPLIATFNARQARPDQVAEQVGADAFLVRPYRRDALLLALYAARGAQLLRDRAVRSELALGGLTGARGRGGREPALLHADVFKTLLPVEIRRARRHGYPIAICVVALDPMPIAESLNPQVVTAAEPFLRGAVRDVDLAVRYGEGRFLVFLPHTDARGAEVVGKRIVAGMRNCRFKADGVTLMVTASVGIAVPRAGQGMSFARLIRDAHAAVKAAQLKGGDRAILR